ncbi:MAG: recombinase RecA [Sedimentisphaerales bacterium]|nr:recombinase RecA [Sedimentisphaerales bacterium]
MTKTKTSQQSKGAVEPLRPEASGAESALQRVIAQIEKQYGRGAIMQMDEHKYARIQGISTGALSLDIALGGAGIPRGRITELFGPESSGKTTLALHIIANAQKAGGVAAFIDAEHALDTTWAKRLGVDVSSLLISQPDNGEQALDIVEMLIGSNSVDVVVVDSVAALTPRAEIEGEMGDSHMGLQARLMSQAMRKLTSVIARSKTALIFINQIRMKIGVMFGNPETTTGGNALKFYSSVRIDLRRITTIKEATGAVGSRVRARVVKNKIAPPFRESEFDVMFDHGISYEGDLLDLGTACNVIEKSGAHLGFGEIRLGQGREKARQFLADNKDLCEQIKHKILVAKGLVEDLSAGADK